MRELRLSKTQFDRFKFYNCPKELFGSGFYKSNDYYPEWCKWDPKDRTVCDICWSISIGENNVKLAEERANGNTEIILKIEI
jgi:hypothetical protein